LDLNLRKNPVKFYIWSIVVYGDNTWTLREGNQKYLEMYVVWCWRRMQTIILTGPLKNEAKRKEISYIK
jgi:hypothetical protein